MLESIALIIGVASSLLTCMGYVKQLGTDRKERIENYFTAIADTIDLAVSKFKNDEIPHGACDMMQQYALEMPSVLDGIILPEKLQEYSHKLHQAHNIEMLYIQVKNNESALIELEKAASIFRVAATVVKTSK